MGPFDPMRMLPLLYGRQDGGSLGGNVLAKKEEGGGLESYKQKGV